MEDKKFLMKPYFKEWNDSLRRAKLLLEKEDYYLEAVLILSCYIGAFSSLRYPTIDYESERYKKVVQDYSGLRDLYEEIDLLFFYNWPTSDFKNHGEYKKLKNYSDLVKIMMKKYGDQNKVKESIRYISQNDFIDFALSESTGLDEENMKEYMPLFSLCEILYRYLRCYAVHNAIFPFMSKVLLDNGSTIYRDNHKITGSVLFQTVQNILNNIESECMSKSRWPYEL